LFPMNHMHHIIHSHYCFLWITCTTSYKIITINISLLLKPI